MTNIGLNPSYLLEIGLGYRTSKTLLSAVELDLFSHIDSKSMTGKQIGDDLGLHPRAISDFLDSLVALHVLERDGDDVDGRYRNSPEAATFLNSKSPSYIGGLFKMENERLYQFWNNLTEAVKTGKPQNEIKYSNQPVFEELYSDKDRTEQFLHAMRGLSAEPLQAFAERFDFSNYKTVCDIGGATGQLSMTLASRHSHLHCTSFDLPAVAPIAEKSISTAGMSDRVTVASGNIFTDPLPQTDIITMSMILHDWNLEQKKQLIRIVYDALPTGGVFIAIEHLIDDARRENISGLMQSLNMLIEFGDAFDFTGSDLTTWCKDAGFRTVDILSLTNSRSAGIAYK